jgi:hypothetical protein
MVGQVVVVVVENLLIVLHLGVVVRQGEEGKRVEDGNARAGKGVEEFIHRFVGLLVIGNGDADSILIVSEPGSVPKGGGRIEVLLGNLFEDEDFDPHFLESGDGALKALFENLGGWPFFGLSAR